MFHSQSRCNRPAMSTQQTFNRCMQSLGAGSAGTAERELCYVLIISSQRSHESDSKRSTVSPLTVLFEIQIHQVVRSHSLHSIAGFGHPHSKHWARMANSGKGICRNMSHAVPQKRNIPCIIPSLYVTISITFKKNCPLVQGCCSHNGSLTSQAHTMTETIRAKFLLQQLHSSVSHLTMRQYSTF